MQGSHRIKTLVAAMAAALLATGNADALEVDLYGVAHLSVDSNDDGNTSQVYVASNSSRLGFRGNQPLASGFKAVFQYEAGVDLTGRGTNDGNGGGSSNNLFSTSRDAFVGLAGPFGTVMAGRLGVLNQWVYDYNLFADQVGDLGNIWGGTGIPGRLNGTVAYATPKIADVVDGLFAYHPESGTNNADDYVIKVNYGDDRGIKLGLAYASVGSGNPNFVGTNDQTAFALTGSYSMGDFTVGAGYQKDSNVKGASNDDRDGYTLGASYRFNGNTTVKAQYVTSNANLANMDANMWTLGVDYALDKSTTIYLAYSSTSNDPLATFTANDYGHGQAVNPGCISHSCNTNNPAISGLDPSSFSIGLVYKFDVGLVK